MILQKNIKVEFVDVVDEVDQLNQFQGLRLNETLTYYEVEEKSVDKPTGSAVYTRTCNYVQVITRTLKVIFVI